MAKRKKSRPSYDTRPGFLGWLIKWMFVAALWAGIVIGCIFAWYAQELPSITRNASFERKASITVKAADGSIIGRYGDDQGDNIAAKDLPKNLVYAVLSVEDRRFYSHWGVDVIGFTRAMFVNAREGKVVQGGSTITQQLAKNLFLSQERTLKRKIQEAMLALWLEHELTKDEILAAYLNRVYMGSGTYGVDAATRLYFKKDVKDLTVREAATLAGLLKAPSRFSPLANPGLSKQRTDTVLQTMVDAGYITDKEAKHLTASAPKPAEKPTSGDSEKYYADWIVDNLQDLIGTPEEDIIVETTMNASIQRVAEASLIKAITDNGEAKKISQGAVVVMRPTGEVVAMVGGYNYSANQFNRATQARRQPGSSFKPIVYLAALESGWGPETVIVDEPFTEGRYRPKNFGGEYYGEVTLATALALSLNTVSVRLAKAMGPAKIVDTARRLGITTKLNEDLSLALGTPEMPPLEMTTAYAAIANGGMAIQPFGITKITNESGKLYYQRRPPSDTMRVVSSVYIDVLTGMMQNVIEYGTGQRAKLGYPAYGKTGTSQDSRDAWFIGFTPELVASVWMGNDDNSPMKNVTGGSFPAGVWRDVMASSRGKYPAVRYPRDNAGFSSLMDRLMAQPFPHDNEGALQAQDGYAYYNSDGSRQQGFTPRQRPVIPKNIPEAARYND
jgi:penicillin-binding protein 1A